MKYIKITAILMPIIFLLTLLNPLTALATQNTASSMRLKKTQKTVAVVDKKSKQVPVRERMKLYDGYNIGTDKKSYAWVDLDVQKLIKLDEASNAVINKKAKDLEINLETGRLFFNVAKPLEDDESLYISTSSLAVGIRGTCGWVEVLDEKNVKKAKVSVLEGTIEVTVKDPSTGKIKTETVTSGETVTGIIATSSGAYAETRIIKERFIKNAILGFVLAEIAPDSALAQKIYDKSNKKIDLRNITETQATERLATDQKLTEKKLEHIGGIPAVNPVAALKYRPAPRKTSTPKKQATQPIQQSVTHPTQVPSAQPTQQPSQPVAQPTHPTTQPTQPTTQPTQPTTKPTQPTTQPTQPTTQPTQQPVTQPTQPTTQPTTQPVQPSTQPSQPTTQPVQPSTQPSPPTTQPSQSSPPATQLTLDGATATVQEIQNHLNAGTDVTVNGDFAINDDLTVPAGTTINFNGKLGVAAGKNLNVNGAVNAQSDINNSGTINVASGDSLYVNGTLDSDNTGALKVLKTGKVKAVNITGTLVITPGGTVLQESGSPATVTVGGGYTALNQSFARQADGYNKYELVGYKLESGTLTIAGNGAMPDFPSYNTSPFHNNTNIKSIVIENGVTKIGDNAFVECQALKAIPQN